MRHRGMKIPNHKGCYLQPDGRVLAVAYVNNKQIECIHPNLADAKSWRKNASRMVTSRTPRVTLSISEFKALLLDDAHVQQIIKAHNPNKMPLEPSGLMGLMFILLPEKAKLRDWKNQRRYWIRLAEHFGDRQLKSFNMVDFNLYRQSLEASGKSVATVNRHLEPIVTLFKFALSCGWVAFVPAVPMRTERNRKVLRFGLDDALRVMRYLPPPPETIRAMVAMGINTGMRLADLRKIKWSDLHNNRILVKSSKTDAVGTLLPLWNFTLRELHLVERVSEFIFVNQRTGKPYTKINGTLSTACRQAGVQRFTTHALRNLAISLWQYHLKDPVKTARLLGTTIENVTRYSMAEAWASSASTAIDSEISSALKTMTPDSYDHDPGFTHYPKQKSQTV